VLGILKALIPSAVSLDRQRILTLFARNAPNGAVSGISWGGVWLIGVIRRPIRPPLVSLQTVTVARDATSIQYDGHRIGMHGEGRLIKCKLISVPLKSILTRTLAMMCFKGDTLQSMDWRRSVYHGATDDVSSVEHT
jgi:hypothetical protein